MQVTFMPVRFERSRQGLVAGQRYDVHILDCAGAISNYTKPFLLRQILKVLLVSYFLLFIDSREPNKNHFLQWEDNFKSTKFLTIFYN